MLRLTGQGDNTTGPVPSHMLKALIVMITTTKITTRTAIFASVDLMDPHSPLPDRHCTQFAVRAAVNLDELSQMPIGERNTGPGFQVALEGEGAALVGIRPLRQATTDGISPRGTTACQVPEDCTRTVSACLGLTKRPAVRNQSEILMASETDAEFGNCGCQTTKAFGSASSESPTASRSRASRLWR